MEVYYDIRDVKNYPNPVVALGNFDGVHLGHRELVRRTRKMADEISGTPVVFTFDPHPLKVLLPDSYPPLLLPKEEKIKMMAELGIAVMVIAGFSRRMANLEPADFMKKILVEGVGAKGIIVGYNFSFGKGGKGTPELLREYAPEGNYRVDVVPPVTVDGVEVSSTLIRQLLLRGEVTEARKYLGYFPYVRGKVVYGVQLGRKIGFPTANLDLNHEILVPAKGVYAVRVSCLGEKHCGVANIGNKPTLKKENPVNLEVHIFDFDGNLYGHEIKVEFVARLRAEKSFQDLEELTRQICIDAGLARRILNQVPENK
ncbi:bifunctional riboflavin kinase/FAD synthetase [Thermincola potens]|uniref:Riboflavin biosynthesis protein n=1 Tax=Thermincola potens (strain JR) TaxID=635013 RepID=D5XF17_THEPJ|nr:bifunctional riboflavin kinase/FAD synthetase [Thermincola potens]ADG82238.1 riboflavin biosynthesis protein RibF [Thermincola potens JR]